MRGGHAPPLRDGARCIVAGVLTGSLKGLRFAAVPAGRPCGPPLTDPGERAIEVSASSGRDTVSYLFRGGTGETVRLEEVKVLRHEPF
jgi:hypothetical protein